eukprot:s2154_g11.t1
MSFTSAEVVGAVEMIRRAVASGEDISAFFDGCGPGSRGRRWCGRSICPPPALLSPRKEQEAGEAAPALDRRTLSRNPLPTFKKCLRRHMQGFRRSRRPAVEATAGGCHSRRDPMLFSEAWRWHSDSVIHAAVSVSDLLVLQPLAVPTLEDLENSSRAAGKNFNGHVVSRRSTCQPPSRGNDRRPGHCQGRPATSAGAGYGGPGGVGAQPQAAGGGGRLPVGESATAN